MPVQRAAVAFHRALRQPDRRPKYLELFSLGEPHVEGGPAEHVPDALAPLGHRGRLDVHDRAARVQPHVGQHLLGGELGLHGLHWLPRRMR